jgi:hypothetical protein
MPYDPNQNDPVGSGNPYYGSGFTNFDNFLQKQNLDWGAQQKDYITSTSDFDTGGAFDNWMIQASHPEWSFGTNQKPGPVTPPPDPGTGGTGIPPPPVKPDPWATYQDLLSAWEARHGPDSVRNGPKDGVNPVAYDPRPQIPKGYNPDGTLKDPSTGSGAKGGDTGGNGSAGNTGSGIPSDLGNRNNTPWPSLEEYYKDR